MTNSAATGARTVHRLHLDGVDAFGIVYFARYWDWYHHTFEKLLAALGHPLPETLAEGYGFPAVHAEIDYRRMLTLGELVECDLRLVTAGARSVTLAGRFTNDRGEELAHARTVHVATARGGSPVPLPAWLRAAASSA